MKQVYPISIQSGMSQSDSFILMLCEPTSNRQVPIFIGRHEAQGILLAKDHVDTRRPLTHQTMQQMMEVYGLSLDSVSIDRVLDGIFYATLHLTDGFNPKEIDCRPSDAVTMALLFNAPILMNDKVLEETGVAAPPTAADSPTPVTIEELEEKLRRCEQEEDYESAAEIMKQIEKLKHEL